jgi:hypothetical protein
MEADFEHEKNTIQTQNGRTQERLQAMMQYEIEATKSKASTDAIASLTAKDRLVFQVAAGLVSHCTSCLTCVVAGQQLAQARNQRARGGIATRVCWLLFYFYLYLFLMNEFFCSHLIFRQDRCAELERTNLELLRDITNVRILLILLACETVYFCSPAQSDDNDTGRWTSLDAYKKHAAHQHSSDESSSDYEYNEDEENDATGGGGGGDGDDDNGSDSESGSDESDDGADEPVFDDNVTMGAVTAPLIVTTSAETLTTRNGEPVGDEALDATSRTRRLSDASQLQLFPKLASTGRLPSIGPAVSRVRVVCLFVCLFVGVSVDRGFAAVDAAFVSEHAAAYHPAQSVVVFILFLACRVYNFFIKKKRGCLRQLSNANHAARNTPTGVARGFALLVVRAAKIINTGVNLAATRVCWVSNQPSFEGKKPQDIRRRSAR